MVDSRSADREQTPDRGVVRVYHTLGQASGTRRIHDVEHIVVRSANLWLSSVPCIAKYSITLGEMRCVILGYMQPLHDVSLVAATVQPG